jgi:hypothetical protein
MHLFPLLRKKSLVTIAWTMVALQLFNISFDPADQLYGTEDLSINDIESCVEMIVEEVLGHEDAIEEADEADEGQEKPGSTITLFSVFHASISIERPSKRTRSHHSIFKNSSIESLSPPIISPPPKLL